MSVAPQLKPLLVATAVSVAVNAALPLKAHAVAVQVQAEGGVVGEHISDIPPYSSNYQGFRVPMRFTLEARPSNTVSLFGDVRFNFQNHPTPAMSLGNTTEAAPESFRQPVMAGSEKQVTLESGVAYLQWASPIGLVRVGRMPRHWGLGIWRSTDMDLTGGALSTSDALSMTMDFTPSFSATLHWEKILEGNPYSRADDADAYTAEVLIADEPSDTNSYGVARQIGVAFQRYDHAQTSTRLLTMDLFTKLFFDEFGIEGEVYFPTGDTKNPAYASNGGTERCTVRNPNNDFVTCSSQRVEGLAALGRVRYQLSGSSRPMSGTAVSLIGNDIARLRRVPTSLRNESHIFGLSLGYVRGDKDAFEGIANKDSRVRATVMNPNIRPSLLMYGFNSANIPGMPGSTMTNTSFIKFDYTYEVSNFGAITPSLVWGVLNETNTKNINIGEVADSAVGKKQNLGLEFDLGYRYLTVDNIELGLDTGIWFPGEAWSSKLRGKPASVFGARAILGTRF